LLEKRNREKSIILDYANTAIGTVNTSGNLLSCNNYFASIFGYSKKELLQLNISNLVPRSELESLLRVFNNALASRDSHTLTLIGQTKDRQPIRIEFTMQLEPTNNKLVVVLNSLEDKITIEEQNNILRNINQNLKQKIDDEVAKNLKQHEIMVQEQMENIKFTTIGKLTAGITHEINTPLTYVKANFELLYEDVTALSDNNLKSELLHSIDSIGDGISRISTIVESMHEMAHKPKIIKEPTNIY
jgi:two-component system sporulation sensor kinase A